MFCHQFLSVACICRMKLVIVAWSRTGCQHSRMTTPSALLVSSRLVRRMCRASLMSNVVLFFAWSNTLVSSHSIGWCCLQVCSAMANFTWCGCCTYVSDFVFEVVWNTFFALYIQDLELRIQQFYLCYGKPLRKLCVCVCVCVYMRTTVCDQ